MGRTKKTNKRCQIELLEWMENNTISDIWRLRNPGLRKYTWVSKKKPVVMCRLDFILISDNLQGYVKNTDIIPGFRSDHSCTTITILLNEPLRGKGYWKFNNSLTKDKELKTEIENTVQDTLKDNQGTEENLMWDLIKCKIRGTCLMYASRRKKKRKERQFELEKEIEHIEASIQKGRIEGEDEDTLTRKEEELSIARLEEREYITEHIKGEALRSRSLWHEEGNTASKMFLNLEKSRGERKTIRRLKNTLGKTVTDRKEILEEEEKFYNKLYSEQEYDQTEMKKGEYKEIWEIEGKTLDEEDLTGLTEPFTEEEIWSILKDNPKNKSPGTDGLTNEFYIEYWQIVKEHLIKSLNKGLVAGKLNISQRRGVISLIPKPQKDLELLKNWRPITLLNTDYKLLTKGIANRIKPILHKIISDDQGGFVKGRYIGCNIQRITSMINICEESEVNNILVNIDFEKAFDTIKWDFILQSMKNLNFPEPFIKWIKALYTDIETCVMNNGFTTKYFKPERGVRQGCPLSPYLFIITTEIMNRWLKKHLEQHGTTDKEGNNYLISQFADDTSFAVHCNKQALDTLFKYLEVYGRITGLKINIEKTEILLLGKTNIDDVPKRYRKHIKESVKYLGCNIYKEHKSTTEKNTEEAVKKIEALLKKWEKRHITLSGRIAVIKSLLLPQLTYTLSTLPSPSKETIKQINSLFFKFIHKGGSEKIKRTILIGDYSTGGYKMTDLVTYIKAIKIRWMERLISIPGLWKKELENSCNLNLGVFCRCNTQYKDLPFKMPNKGMWDEILQEWCKENFRTVNSLDEIMQQCLWYNSHIKIQKKVLLWKKWDEQGIRWIADLLKEEQDGRLYILTREELEEYYDLKIPHMTYNSLLSAIPKAWKQKIRGTPNLNEEETEEEDYKLIDQLLDNKKPMQMMYNKLVKKKIENPTNAMAKWNRDLKLNILEKEMLKAHKENHWSISNHKFRSFNCKFFNRSIPTNKGLTLMNKADNMECRWCGKLEDIKHLYWECRKKRDVWKQLGVLYREITGKTLFLRKEKCLLGIFTTTRLKPNKVTMQLQRSLCLITKYYIHWCKCLDEKEPTREGLTEYLREYIRIEEDSAKQKGWEGKFREKWGRWSTWAGDRREREMTR
jgi:hypothetical protein